MNSITQPNSILVYCDNKKKAVFSFSPDTLVITVIRQMLMRIGVDDKASEVYLTETSEPKIILPFSCTLSSLNIKSETHFTRKNLVILRYIIISDKYEGIKKGKEEGTEKGLGKCAKY